MTDREKAQAAIAQLKGTTFGYRVRPHSPRWNKAMALLESIGESSPPPPPPPPPPPTARIAPRTYNKSAGGDARFCTSGLPRNSAGRLFDDFSEYDDDGRSWGGRDPNRIVPFIKPSNEMDGRGPCDAYENGGRQFPPWPPESYLR